MTLFLLGAITGIAATITALWLAPSVLMARLDAAERSLD